MGSVDTRSRSIRRVLASRPLRLVALGYGLFGLAESATWIAVTVFAFARGGVAEAGVVSVVQLVPGVVAAPFAAYAGDRFRRDIVLVAGYAAQAAMCTATAATMWLDAPAVVVYTAATAAAVAFTFTRPAVGAVLPAATETAAELTAANVTLGVISRTSELVGPLIAALLLAGDDGPARVLAVSGGATLVAALAAGRPGFDRTMLRPRRDIDAGDVVDDAFGGFRTLRREGDLRLLVFVAVGSAFLVGAADVLYVTVAEELVDGGTASTAGFLAAASGLGGVLGAVGSAGLVGRPRLSVPLVVALAAGSVALAAIAALSQVASIALAFAGFGAGYSVSRVALKSLVQRRTPGAVLARVLGVVEGLELAGMAAGSLAVAVVARLFDVRTAIVVIGLGVAIALVARWGRLARVDAAATPPDPALLALVRANPIFAGLPPPTLERLLVAMAPFAAAPASVLVRQGDPGNRYYLISDGEVAVSVDGVEVRRLGPGGGFGEIALVRDVPRTATATSITPVRGFTVERHDFLDALSGHGLTMAHDHAQRLLDEDRSRGGDRQSG